MVAGREVAIPLDVRSEGSADCQIDLPELKCNISLPINTTVVELPADCPQNKKFNRTFCVTDSLNAAPITICASQIITVCDTKAPAVSAPPSRTIECSEPIPARGGSTSDNCDANPIFNVTEVKVPGSCPGNYTLVRTYRSVDHCGNANVSTSTITVQDTTAPVISGVPNRTNEYFCNLPPLPLINATDNCGIDYTQWPKITSVKLPLNVSGLPLCPQNYLQRYTVIARDLCGNTARSTFDVMVTNRQPPTLSNVPVDTILNCNDTLPVYRSRPTASARATSPVASSSPPHAPPPSAASTSSPTLGPSLTAAARPPPPSSASPSATPTRPSSTYLCRPTSPSSATLSPPSLPSLALLSAALLTSLTRPSTSPAAAPTATRSSACGPSLTA